MSSAVYMLTPVALPTGLFKLETTPKDFGSMAIANTIGLVFVAAVVAKDPVCASGGSNHLNVSLNKVCD